MWGVFFWDSGGDSKKASAQDFVNKGPQMVSEGQDLPPVEGKEELKRRMEELNK